MLISHDHVAVQRKRLVMVEISDVNSDRLVQAAREGTLQYSLSTVTARAATVKID